MEPIRFRPHHFMCTLGFRGKGYSSKFVANYKKIAAVLHNDENTMIEVAGRTDDICAPCPHRQTSVICRSENKIQRLDAGHAAVLELKVGEKLSWAEAKRRIATKMTVQAFHEACAGCEWKPYGICEDALIQLQNL